MKRVLIPTDFTVESLQLLEYAILNFPRTELDITLVYGFVLPDSRWGLIHYSAGSEISKLTSPDYAKAKNAFVREHSDVILDLRIELFTGSNSFAFQNFIEQLDIRDAIIPKGKFLNFDHSRCFDPSRLIRKNVENVIEIPLDVVREYPKTKFSLSSLLNL